MTSTTKQTEPRLPLFNQRQPLLKLFFGDALAGTLTIFALLVIFAILPGLNWATLDAHWSVTNPGECREGGACWAFVSAKLNLILFGLYPPSEQWRPTIVIAVILVMILLSLSPRLWSGRLLAAWAVAVVAMIILMRGGVFGLSFVSTAQWGGLPVTLMLATFSLGLAFPLAVLLALGRRGKLPIARAISVTLIELVRGLPLVGLLFVAAILLPLLLPSGWTVDKLGRTLAALTLFASAYLAEVIRGGLQGLDDGQVEAAEALGIPYWKTIWNIVLPQAIQNVIPPLTNTAIVMVKNTSLVFIVGVFDMLSAARSAATDPAWPGPYSESYLFVAVIYFAICYGIAFYSRNIEQAVQARRHS